MESAPTESVNESRRLWTASFGGVGAGIVYALSMYLLGLFDFPVGFVSFTGLIGTPLVLGAVCVGLSLPEQRARLRYRVFAPWLAIALLYVVFLLIKWETVICLIMLAPLTLGLASIGGLVTGWLIARLQRARTSRGMLGCFVLLPLLCGQFEAAQPAPVEIRTVTDRIVIDAPTDKVWRTLIDVPDIQDRELNWSFSHAIGLPKPRAALLHGNGVGSVRDLYWDDGIHFRERVTDWQPGRRLAYDVDVSPAQTALRRLDTHVVIGDRYFDVERGEYDLRAMAPGETELRLSTTYRISTQVNGYGNFWAYRTLDDFHSVVLGLLKHRAESI
jgi:hypothetical protein